MSEFYEIWVKHIQNLISSGEELSWAEYFINQAVNIALKSKDRSTKVGALAVGAYNEPLTTGFNGFPRNINDYAEARHQRPLKYSWVEHAERNVVDIAARIGVALEGSTLYMNYEPIPCTDCSRGIIQAGIKAIIGPKFPFPGVGKQWESSMAISIEMLLEAGVELYYYDLDTREVVLRNN